MAPATTSPRGPKRTSSGAGGFTLVEVSLTLTLLVLLAGVSMYGFSGWQRTAALNEGADRFATLLRAARIEASSIGKRLRLVVAADEDVDVNGASFELMWEPDPLAEPGRFVPYGGLLTGAHDPVSLVRIRRCRLTGDSAYRVLAYGQADVDENLHGMTFYPDGSSDSAQIALISTNKRDRRGAVIELNGLIGTIRTEIMVADEFEQRLDESQ